MKNIFAKIFTLISALAFVSCNSGTNDTSGESRSSDALIMSTLWLQKSHEARWLLEQNYEQAKGKLMVNRMVYAYSPKLAVVLDLDETVLDNSPYEARVIKEGSSFSKDSWTAWVQEAKADLIPGSKSFLNFADSLGVEIFYISNRSIENLGATINNLNAHRLPNADSSHILLKNDNSDKTFRRALVSKQSRIILLIGDQLGDFNESVSYEMRDTMLQHFILLPNPIYGNFSRLPDSIKPNTETEKLSWFRQQLNSK
jgi:5'-nucleotidase (lipoprotein e(P4) family)